jgi:dipeptidyl aminopeptidase/acylaminoacyl peptidase
MQDDLTDGVRHLIDRGIADPRRVCIVGASYGGYAALAGAALTPDLYRCAVSVAGVSDLAEFIAWRKWKWGADSEGYTYWLTSIGDPKRDAEKLAAVSPARLAAAIKAPVLLIHGDQDGIVPIAQSLAMQKALGKVGRKTELMTLVDEGHWGWSIDNERRVLIGIDRFLWEHLGPGVGVTEAPPTLLPAAE